MKKLKMFLAGLLAVSLLVACSDDEKKEKKPVTPPEPVEAVTFTPAGGEVESGATVTLATATEGASIYYVFGGKAVDLTESYATDGTLYTAPVAITEAGVLSAVAVKDKTVSTLTTADYTIAAPTETPDDANDIKDGLKENVTAYWVSDVAGLKKLSELVNGGNALAGYTFVVKNDIKINDNVIQPKFLEPAEKAAGEPTEGLVNLDSIGTGKTTAFSGIFDGNNKVIDGFYAYQGHQGLGFFGCISGAKIKNVILTNACVINMNTDASDPKHDGADDDRFGGLVGVAAGESTIKDCVFTGVVGSQVAKDRGGSYEYLDGFVGRADAKVTTSGCIVFARAYGTPSIKVAIDGDVTKIDAATYTEGAYTGDNAYVLAAIALLNKEPPSVAKAVFTTAAGEVAYGTAVEITCETEGAEILYKVGDGEFAAYDASSKPVVKAESVTITAYTELRDENGDVIVASDPVSATYTVAAPAAPVIDPNGGDFVTGNSQTVTITTETAGAFVVYKFGEVSENTADYTEYDAENKPVVSATSTIVAVAVIGEEGAYITSDPVTAAFTFTDPAKPNTPAPAIAKEAVIGGYNVTITCTDADAAIYYSTAAFTAEDLDSVTAYTDAFKVEDTATIYALSVKEGENAGSASLEITVPEVTLTIAPEAGAYTADTEITITAEDGATITYSTDGENFAAYDAANKPKVIAGTVTAKAEKEGCKASTATAAYTLLVPPTTPYAETNPGKIEYKARLRFYAEVGTVYWQFVEPGAESTLNGSNYTEVATAYSGSIGCEEHTSGGSYYCIAVHDGLTSDIVSFTYTYDKPAGLADGLAAVDEKIATLSHATVTATADIKDGLVDGVTEYVVSNADGLDVLAALVTGGKNLEGYTFTQSADIIFNETVNGEGLVAPVEEAAGTPAAGLRTFAGIGNGSKAFAGTYDGNNYKIKGMYIYGNHSTLGFVCLSTLTTVLKNIVMVDASVVADAMSGDSDDRVAGFIGKIGDKTAPSAPIDNCIFVGSVGSEAAKGRNTTEYFAALIGDANKATVTVSNCLVVARITAKQSSGIICEKNNSGLTATNVVTYDATIE